MVTRANVTKTDRQAPRRRAGVQVVPSDTARLRAAALELLDAIHEKMAGVTEEEVLAALAADNKEARRKASSDAKPAGGRQPRRTPSA